MTRDAEDFVVYCIGRGHGEHAPAEVWRYDWHTVTWREGTPWEGGSRRGLASRELRCEVCGRTARVKWRDLIAVMVNKDAAGESAAELGRDVR